MLTRAIGPIAAIAISAATCSAFGHDGEDHSAPQPPVNHSVAPRAVAATDEFEVVAVLEGNRLVLYVDRYASNEPVLNAKVEVEGGGLKGPARPATPGTYVMDIAATLPAGKHALTIGIDAGDSADLIPAMLDTSPPAPPEPHIHRWNERVVWSVAAVLMLAGGALLVARRRRSKIGERWPWK